MKRLVHSPQGYLRQMQMSKARVWIFFEGKTDRYFYSKLAEATAEECGKTRTFQVASADELAPDGGGKSVLVKFFEFLRDGQNLVSRLAGRETRSVFFLDKDVDDILGKRIASPHVIYTDFYSLESYLFKYGNIVDACAVSLALPLQDVRRVVPDADSWRIRCALLWKDWLSVCLFAARSGIGIASFSAPSRVNLNTYEGVDGVLLAQMEAVCLSAATNAGDPLRLLTECRQMVSQHYAANNHDRIFNGKWYAHFLEDHINKSLPNASSQGLSKKIPLHLAQSLRFEDQWAKHLRSKLAMHLGV
ncbi:hypothetical protein [Micromonospora echinospora]|uniref:hypothetical protein n=1 Tax=Micromonospora echinospora TaxID=1877 RepID=UPI003A848264